MRLINKQNFDKNKLYQKISFDKIFLFPQNMLLYKLFMSQMFRQKIINY